MERVRNFNRFAGGSALAALTLALLAGCGQNAGAPTTDEEASASATPTAEATPASYVVEETAAPTVAEVAPVPAATATTDPADAAPLDDAATIARRIADGHGIERIRHGDGWAWMQDGRIVRTASADGSQVAYFRNGSDDPFLVQNGDHAYAYSGNAVTRAYERGRPQKVDPNERDTARRLEGKARDDRASAQQVARTSHRPGPKPSPTPSPTPSPRETSRPGSGHSSGRSGGERDQPPTMPPKMHGRPDPRATQPAEATPTPSPSPTRTHRPTPGPERRVPHASGTPG